MEKDSRFVIIDEQKIRPLVNLQIIVDTLTGIENFYSVGRSGSDSFVPVLNEAGLPRINPSYDPDNKRR